MLIGIDFDNTIVSYDTLFHRVARERSLIPPGLPITKTAVRDHLRASGHEDEWTELQGEVYGARLMEAAPFPGVKEFFTACHERGIRTVVISHKTRHPYLGTRHDLHGAARRWLEAKAWPGGPGPEDAWFEPTKADKLARIGSIGCTHFIDDLPEILTDAAFPTAVDRILFDPQGLAGTGPGIRVAANWSTITNWLFIVPDRISAVDRILVARRQRRSGTPRRVNGGANNQISEQPLESPATSVIVKRYFTHAGDRRDRFQSEKAFYAYAADVARMFVPDVIGWDAEERIGVFEHVQGDRPERVSPKLLRTALDFLAALNARRDSNALARALPAAAEACFSLAQHLATVGARMERLTLALAEAGADAEARELVHGEIQPVWQAIEAKLLERSGSAPPHAELPRAARCISPSDFGFHNCLVTRDGRIVFIDFEYAGWDDPAKLVSDFFCQPDVPVPREWLGVVVDDVARNLGLAEPAGFAARCHALLPVYELKWACIMLNDFTAIGRSRREFSLGVDAARARRAQQLARVRRMLSKSPVAV